MLIHLTAADLGKWVAFGQCVVNKITGFNGQATDVYLQLFDVLPDSATSVAAATFIANTAIPQGGSLLLQAKNGFSYDFGPCGLTLKALVVMLSTTQPNLTQVAAAGGVDMVLDVSGPALVANFSTLTLVGDLTTSVTSLQVWSEANGPQTLIRLDVRAVSGTAHFAALYAVDTPAATSKVLNVYGIASAVANESDYNFVPFEKTPDQVLHAGLTVSAQQDRAAQTIPGLNMKCRALYY